MKEISVQLTSKSLTKKYAISLDDDFAKVFGRDWRILTRGSDHLDAGELLEAYIQKSYENFMLNKKIDALVTDIDEGVK